MPQHTLDSAKFAYSSGYLGLFLVFFVHLPMGLFVVKRFLRMAVLAGVRSMQGRLQKQPPPPPAEASLAPSILLPDPAADLPNDEMEEVRIDAPPDPGSGT